ncbi:MAG: hypothetical protein ACYCUI_17030 [Vulcanimicrobiaceae bacterium]
MSDLQRELAAFEHQLPGLLGTPGAQGKYAVIYGDQVLGMYDTYADALQLGYQTAGANGHFLVKRISPAETVAYYSRDLACPA